MLPEIVRSPHRRRVLIGALLGLALVLTAGAIATAARPHDGRSASLHDVLQQEASVYLPLGLKALGVDALPTPEQITATPTPAQTATPTPEPVEADILFGLEVDDDGHILDVGEAFQHGIGQLCVEIAWMPVVVGTELRWQWYRNDNPLDVAGLNGQITVEADTPTWASSCLAPTTGPVPLGTYEVRFYANGQSEPSASASAVVQEEPPTGATPLPPTATPSPTPTPGPTKEIPPWLQHVNFYRALAHIPPAEENEAWSDGAEKHARYIVKENEEVNVNTEDPRSDWFTEEGREAAKNGIIFIGGDRRDRYDVVFDYWMSSTFHMLSVLNPFLVQTGYGDFGEGREGVVFAATFDVIRGVVDEREGLRYPLRYPEDGQVMPLLQFNTEGTNPNPIIGCGYRIPSGPPIAILLEPDYLEVEVDEVTLTSDGEPVDFCWYDETSYENPERAWQSYGRDVLDAYNAVILIPRRPLTNGKTYTASVTERDTTHTWSFTADRSGDATPMPPATPTPRPTDPVPGGCTQTLVNGDFEAGPETWTLRTNLVENDLSRVIKQGLSIGSIGIDPYRGQWLAGLGGTNEADERLMQVASPDPLPERAEIDSATLSFYAGLVTNEPQDGQREDLMSVSFMSQQNEQFVIPVGGGVVSEEDLAETETWYELQFDVTDQMTRRERQDYVQPYLVFNSINDDESPTVHFLDEVTLTLCLGDGDTARGSSRLRPARQVRPAPERPFPTR